MTTETQQTMSSMTSTDIGMICVTLMILVVVPCVTWLIATGKISSLIWKKGQGLKIEAPDNGNEIALLFLDNLLDDAEAAFKRTMLDNAHECFKENDTGQRYATYIAALNHCLRDLSRVGYNNYIADAQRKGKWSDAEAQCFMRGMLVSARKMIDARLDAYEKCLQFKATDTFRKITEKKIEKNLGYSEMVNRYLGFHGMVSGIIEEGHRRRSSILEKEGNT